MWGVKNTSNEYLSMHSKQADADAQKILFADETLTVSEDTEANITANLKQD